MPSSRITRAMVQSFRAAPTSNLATPAEWLISALGGGLSKSGQSVTADNALGHPDVWGCLRTLTDAAAVIPLHTYKDTPGGRLRTTRTSLVGRTLMLPSTTYRVDQSNWNSTAMLHLNTWGEFYAGKIRSRGALVDELIPIHPSRVTVDVQDNDIAFIIAPTAGRGTGGTYYSDDIFRVVGMSRDGFRGLSPIAYLREAIGTGLTFEEYAGGLAGNQFAPPIYLKSQKVLGDDAAKSLTENFKKKFFGQRAIGEIPVLEEGVELASPIIPAKDAEFIAQRNFNGRQIAVIFRVPAWKLGVQQSGTSMTYANVEQEQLDFLMWSVYPWLHRVEVALSMDGDLFGPDQEQYPEYLLDAALRADSKTRSEVYNVAVDRWMTRNEIRTRENLPLWNGGDELAPIKDPNAPARATPTAREDESDKEARDEPGGTP